MQIATQFTPTAFTQELCQSRIGNAKVLSTEFIDAA